MVVTLTQDALTAQALAHGRCTAKLFEFSVTARSAAGGFQPGPALTCAHAAFIPERPEVETHQWCRAEKVTLAARLSAILTPDLWRYFQSWQRRGTPLRGASMSAYGKKRTFAVSS